MKQVPDRKKLRREYLRKKVRYSTVIVLCLVGTICFVPFVIQNTMESIRNFSPASLGISAFILQGGLMIWLGISAMRLHLHHARTQAKKLTFVPPVTADTLPAEEILVRGSQEPPVVRSDILLRVPDEQNTLPEELLKASLRKP